MRGTPDRDELPAGDFAEWLAAMHGALAGEHDADVPCGECTACCTSSQFVHIDPDEHDTLAHIPRQLLFPAPGLPKGHLLLGYDERGHCPMLVEGRCSIYEHRPRTCRVYDCRVFPATGVDVSAEKPAIGAQVRRWRFTFASPEDEQRHAALVAKASMLTDVPWPTQRAVAAIESVRVSISSRRRPTTPDSNEGRPRGRRG